MNYIRQLNEFYSTLDYKPLSANAIAIYMLLLHIANKTGWIDEFKVANSILMSKCKLNISAVQRARNELIVQEYIYYKKGLNQNDAPKYQISKLYFEQANEQADEQANGQPNKQAGKPANEHINKQNKTKQNKKIKEKKEFVPPTLEEIKNYVSEKKLNVDAVQFYDYFTEGNWIDSNGNRVKSWKQKILTWNGYSSNKKQYKPSKPINNMDQRNYDSDKLKNLYANKKGQNNEIM